ncbi:MAG TPA: hypothetical protein VFV19_19440 [Candidatus Polarisedimenticolaceae bacterium]|nr:hypothetical protein [Candidatus Polarisedimenticolaceae bacterium]
MLRRVALLVIAIASWRSIAAEPVAVRHVEGLVHGFLVLRDLDGKAIADGDLVQVAKGHRVTTRLSFRFRDGSLHEETAVWSENGHFQLISDHLVQKGPTFPRSVDLSIDAANGKAEVHYTDGDGKPKTDSDHFKTSPDLANGLVLAMLKNVGPETPLKSFSYVTASPKPMMVTLQVSTVGREKFTTGDLARTAIHYVLKVDIPGIKGALAPIVGKQPPDLHVWILDDNAPAFLKAELPLYFGGPIWRIELASPKW